MMIVLKKIFNFIKNKIFFIEIRHIYELGELTYISSEATIKKVTLDNVCDVSHFQNISYVDIFREFLKIGDCGYYGYIDGKCIHRSWVKFNHQKVYLNQFFPYTLKPNEAYIHYCETSIKARGRNVYQNVLSIIAIDNLDKKIIISADDKNFASVKAIKKVGFKEREQIKTFVFFGIKFIKITSVK